MREFSRFVGKVPQHESLDAPLRHIQTNAETHRDRFGNRVFSSRKNAYFDREGNENRSILLVSPDGQDLLRSTPGILKTLEQFLAHSGPRLEQHRVIIDKEAHTILEGRGRIEYLAGGNQSLVYRVDIDDRSFVLKIHLPHSNVHQPYVNEMLELQSFGTDCAHDLSSLGVALPRVFFATNDVILEEFVPNELPRSEEFRATFYAAATTADEYLESQGTTPL